MNLDHTEEMILFLLARTGEDEQLASGEARDNETGFRYNGQPEAWVRHVRNWPVDRVRMEVATRSTILGMTGAAMGMAKNHPDSVYVDGLVQAFHSMLAIWVTMWRLHPDFRVQWLELGQEEEEEDHGSK